MLRQIVKHTAVLLTILFLTVASVTAETGAFAKPSAKDKCPVCGMFVSKYPDWVAGMIFKGGKAFFFDGAKDLFKFYFAPQAYGYTGESPDKAQLYVTDYYEVGPVDARKAFYVLGSDVYGPMGKELVPFEKEADATAFLNDHNGQQILQFGEITQEIMDRLDR